MGNKPRLWWTILTGVFAVWMVVLGIGMGLDRSDGTGVDAGNIFALVLFAGAGIAMGIGVLRARRGSTSGYWLTMFAAAPGILSALVFVWFPPMWLSGAAAIAVLVGAIGSLRSARIPKAAA